MAKRKPLIPRHFVASSEPQKPDLGYLDDPEIADGTTIGVEPSDYAYLGKRKFSGKATTGEGWDESVQDLNAPIELPDRQDLAQKLVPINVIYQLEEVRKDETRFINLVYFFGGGILGILVNWLTDDQTSVPRESVVAFIALTIMVGIFLILYCEKRKLVQEKETKLRNYE